MSKLKVGDKVRLISKENTDREFGYTNKMLDCGDAGTISRIIDEKVSLKGDELYDYHIDDFELVEETKENVEEMTKPTHYQTDKGFDVIDFCNAYNLNFNLGANIKYVSRAGKKLYPNMNGQESKLKDLEKALDHLQREIEFTKKEIEKIK